jgi:hypothetical protein
MQNADGASRVEIVIHAVEERLAITGNFSQELLRRSGQRICRISPSGSGKRKETLAVDSLEALEEPVEAVQPAADFL